jgi:hypothetical protein
MQVQLPAFGVSAKVPSVVLDKVTLACNVTVNMRTWLIESPCLFNYDTSC